MAHAVIWNLRVLLQVTQIHHSSCTSERHLQHYMEPGAAGACVLSGELLLEFSRSKVLDPAKSDFVVVILVTKGCPSKLRVLRESL